MKVSLTENDYYYYEGEIMYVQEHLAFKDAWESNRKQILELISSGSEKDKYIKTLEKLVLKHALKSIDNK